jgi:hypothetical protein
MTELERIISGLVDAIKEYNVQSDYIPDAPDLEVAFAAACKVVDRESDMKDLKYALGIRDDLDDQEVLDSLEDRTEAERIALIHKYLKG